jgi:hypothetical protein
MGQNCLRSCENNIKDFSEQFVREDRMCRGIIASLYMDFQSEGSICIMAKQTVTLGIANIALAGNDDPFNDGYTTGYLEFYDERHRPLISLTNHVIRDHLRMIINESSCLLTGTR